MIWDIIFWAAVVYIGGVILWHLFFFVLMIIEGYDDGGFWGALGSASVAFLMGIWNLAKFAIGLVIFALIIRSCSGKDFLGVDNFNISTEAKSMVYFIDSYDYNNPPEYNERLDEFKDKLDNYSDEEVNQLKEFTQKYISYRKSFQDDFRNSFLDYTPGDDFKLITSNKTQQLKKQLIDYGLKEKLLMEDKEIDKIVSKLNDQLSYLDEDEIYQRQELALENENDLIDKMLAVYSDIFNESPSYE